MKLLYFAWIREKTGLEQEEVELPAEIKTIGDVIKWQSERGPQFAEAFGQSEVIRAAVNHSHAKHDQPIEGASEIAFFPPITGG